MLTSLIATLGILLTEGAQSIGVSDIMSILEAVTAVFSIQTIVAFIAGIIAVAMAYVLLWWGVRKGYKAIMGAVTKGKLRIG